MECGHLRDEADYLVLFLSVASPFLFHLLDSLLAISPFICYLLRAVNRLLGQAAKSVVPPRGHFSLMISAERNPFLDRTSVWVRRFAWCTRQRRHICNWLPEPSCSSASDLVEIWDQCGRVELPANQRAQEYPPVWLCVAFFRLEYRHTWGLIVPEIPLIGKGWWCLICGWWDKTLSCVCVSETIYCVSMWQRRFPFCVCVCVSASARDRNKIRSIERLSAPTAVLADKIQQGQLTSGWLCTLPSVGSPPLPPRLDQWVFGDGTVGANEGLLLWRNHRSSFPWFPFEERAN